MNQNAFKDKGPEPMFPACVSLGNVAALGTSQGEPLYIPLPQPFLTVRPFVLGEGRGGESGRGRWLDYLFPRPGSPSQPLLWVQPGRETTQGENEKLRGFTGGSGQACRARPLQLLAG